MSEKFCLGRKVKDTVTGAVGVIESSHEYLHGRDQYGFQQETLADGTVPVVRYEAFDRYEAVEISPETNTYSDEAEPTCSDETEPGCCDTANL